MMYYVRSESCITCFFFSSRRRHTRCLSDCSSDVCSSDLSIPSPSATWRSTFTSSDRRGRAKVNVWQRERTVGSTLPRSVRSEERRVGKGEICGGWQLGCKCIGSGGGDAVWTGD